MSLPVTFDDVLAAKPRVRSVLRATPLLEWPGLSERLGCEFWLKHENHQPVGAFKVRGGVNLVATMSDEERRAGIIGVSTGNHGQSLAFAARRAGMRCTIVVPERSNPDKLQSMRLLGAEVIERGRDFDEAREQVEVLARQLGCRYVHSANEPLLIAGVATMACEIFEVLPEPDVILVPIGLGSGVCGTCLVAKHLRPRTQVIGVQAAGADAVAASWRSGRWVARSRVDTFAEGMATRVPAEMTLAIMRELMDDVILVSDDELREAVYQILKQTHNLAEGAGAATYAAAYQQRERFRGQRVVGVLSGGNLDLKMLPEILAGSATADSR
ncbi:MAG: threonine dehydratase [Planctomycetales bacterium]|nr:threonine dehydratase [Planctomycetales bacterium]